MRANVFPEPGPASILSRLSSAPAMSSACPSRSLFQCGMENSLDYLNRSVARAASPLTTEGEMPATYAAGSATSPSPVCLGRQRGPGPITATGAPAFAKSTTRRRSSSWTTFVDKATLRGVASPPSRPEARAPPGPRHFLVSSTCFNNPSQIAALQRFASDRAYSNLRRTVGRFTAAQTIIRIYEFGFAVGENDDLEIGHDDKAFWKAGAKKFDDDCSLEYSLISSALARAQLLWSV
jgi:hypothetical protein